jgi:hypothetical protein
MECLSKVLPDWMNGVVERKTEGKNKVMDQQEIYNQYAT